MPATRIVETLDEVEDRQSCFAGTLEAVLRKQLTFQSCIETFAHRVAAPASRLGAMSLGSRR